MATDPLLKDAGRIRRMFSDIAPRYDLLNHLLSWNVDRSWRRRAARSLGVGSEAVVLDICTGTADLALEVARSTGARVVGADFTPEMVRRGEEKRRLRGASRVALLVADSLALPFGDASFDAVTVAFGIRNVRDLHACLREMLRVIQPGGKAVILEFAPPPGALLGRLFRWYFNRLLPRIGALVSGTEAGARAYAYLPASVGEFLAPEDLSRAILAAGFESARYERLPLGVSVLHVATRSARPGVATEMRLATAAEGVA